MQLSKIILVFVKADFLSSPVLTLSGLLLCSDVLLHICIHTVHEAMITWLSWGIKEIKHRERTLLVWLTQCSVSFQTAGLISSLFLLCLLLRFLCDSSLRLHGNSRTGLWMQAGYFSFFVVAGFLLCTKRRRCSSHVLSALACIQGVK